MSVFSVINIQIRSNMRLKYIETHSLENENFCLFFSLSIVIYIYEKSLCFIKISVLLMRDEMKEKTNDCLSERDRKSGA